MKIKRQKQARHILNIYKNVYKFHEPYLILVDGTFCQASLKHKIQIRDHLSKYLNSNIQCCTTRCVLSELELLGNQMFGAKIVAQRFQLRHCAHRHKPVPAMECLKSLMHDKSGVRYLIATQDPELTKIARDTPGLPILYVYKNNIVLDKPSKATIEHAKEISQHKVTTPKSELDHLIKLKQEANLLPQKVVRRKRKRAKEPNSLSCKKKKKKNEPSNPVTSQHNKPLNSLIK